MIETGRRVRDNLPEDRGGKHVRVGLSVERDRERREEIEEKFGGDRDEGARERASEQGGEGWKGDVRNKR